MIGGGIRAFIGEAHRRLQEFVMNSSLKRCLRHRL